MYNLESSRKPHGSPESDRAPDVQAFEARTLPLIGINVDCLVDRGTARVQSKPTY
jgi:hypothetical protein